MRAERVYCWEAFDVTCPLMRGAERLYELTQHPDERIPWGWIARSVKGRCQWRPGTWGKHLLLAAESARAGAAADGRNGEDWSPVADAGGPPPPATRLAGFAYGVHLPGFGGYVCYVGVDEQYRRRGVGSRLFDQMFRVLHADAGANDEPLPFVVWESRKPGPDAPATDWKLWEARLKLFERAGGLWVGGLDLMTPNYTDPAAAPVPLQLFVKPMDKPAASFTPAELSAIADRLLERVYQARPGDAPHGATFGRDPQPRLRPAREAGRRPALAAV